MYKRQVRGTGYGVVVPELGEVEIEEPTVMKQGNKFGVRIRSKSPSIHMIKANIETEIAPIVGTEQQAQDLIQYIGPVSYTHLMPLVVIIDSEGRNLYEEGREAYLSRKRD